MSDITPQTPQTEQPIGMDAIIRHYHGRLKKCRTSALTPEKLEEAIQTATDGVLNLTNPESVRDAYRAVIYTLFKRWLPRQYPGSTWVYMDRLVAAREATQSPDLVREINSILITLDRAQKTPEKSKIKRKVWREKNLAK